MTDLDVPKVFRKTYWFTGCGDPTIIAARRAFADHFRLTQPLARPVTHHCGFGFGDHPEAYRGEVDGQRVKIFLVSPYCKTRRFERKSLAESWGFREIRPVYHQEAASFVLCLRDRDMRAFGKLANRANSWDSHAFHGELPWRPVEFPEFL